MMSNNETCTECNIKIRPNNSNFCKKCFRWSHAKCRGIESKFVKNVWLCKSCCRDNFLFSDFEPEPLRTGSDLSNLKSYFNRLNTTSANDEDLDHDDISYINCKYYSCDEFLSIPSKDKSLSFFHSNIPLWKNILMNSRIYLKHSIIPLV